MVGKKYPTKKVMIAEIAQALIDEEMDDSPQRIIYDSLIDWLPGLKHMSLRETKDLWDYIKGDN